VWGQVLVLACRNIYRPAAPSQTRTPIDPYRAHQTPLAPKKSPSYGQEPAPPRIVPRHHKEPGIVDSRRLHRPLLAVGVRAKAPAGKNTDDTGPMIKTRRPPTTSTIPPNGPSSGVGHNGHGRGEDASSGPASPAHKRQQRDHINKPPHRPSPPLQVSVLCAKPPPTQLVDTAAQAPHNDTR